MRLLGKSSAVQTFETKKDLRVGKVALPRKTEQVTPDIIVLEDGSLVLEDPYWTSLKSLEQLKALIIPTKRTPTKSEYVDLMHAWWVACEVRSNAVVFWKDGLSLAMHAWWVACEVRSNAVVFWKDGLSLAIGTGQQDRIGAIENCVDKARRAGHSLKESVMASDGFLPKMDNVEAVAREGVSAIIQPGGSIEDKDLVQACDKHDVAMIFTGERSFRHF